MRAPHSVPNLPVSLRALVPSVRVLSTSVAVLASSATILAVLAVAGCSDGWADPPVVDPETLAAEHAEWREYRRGRLVEPPGGAVLWVGLWDLTERETPFGSDPELPIALPLDEAPALSGALLREERVVTLDPAPGAPLTFDDGTPIASPTELADDRSDEPTTFRIGSLGMRVHAEPGTDRLWLRAWDEEHPARDDFRLPDFFPVDPAWVVRARFDAYDDVRPLRVPDVTGGFVEYQARGELVFRKQGREHRLIATAGETSTRFFVMMWDSTATTETYQGGRYLGVDFPDEDGWTTIDFNRTYNAPCVFTPYSVCALPPRENWLKLPVTAGEKRPDQTG